LIGHVALNHDRALTSGGASPAIQRYYRQTRWDYHFVWWSRRYHAYHFGYHDARARKHGDTLANANRTLAEHARIEPGDRVLDAGCGIGGSSVWLAENRCASTVGISVVPAQLVAARSLATARGIDRRAVFSSADFTHTPFRDASFDVVWALESLCHATDKAAFYREAARLLSPGGRLVVAEYMRAVRPLEPDGEELVREWLEGWAIPDLDTPAEHREHALAAGLVEAVVDDFTPRARPSLRRLYRIASWSYPLAFTARCLRLRSNVQHANVLASIRQYQAIERGYWRYSVLRARKPLP
jgi:cyclopropane fatty-acyl-phospholipid synthase-like methyltransferase